MNQNRCINDGLVVPDDGFCANCNAYYSQWNTRDNPPESESDLCCPQCGECVRLREIRAYLKASTTAPLPMLQVLGEGAMIISHPKTLAVIRAALERELNGDAAHE